MDQTECNFAEYLSQKASVEEKHIKQVMTLVDTQNFSKGEVVLSAGERCRHIFYVEKGLLRFYSLSEDGKEHIVQFGAEGWFVGDRSSFYFDEPSAYYIDAVENAQVVLIGHDFFDQAGTISEEYRSYNEFLLQNHVRHLQNRINLLISAPAEKRYLDFVKMYPDLMLRVPQWMVASYLGITPEGLSRVRKQLAEKNFRPD